MKKRKFAALTANVSKADKTDDHRDTYNGSIANLWQQGLLLDLKDQWDFSLCVDVES